MTTLLEVTPEMCLFGHTSEETALEVEGYPYGRLRTTIRYWLETTNNGDRFCSQTINPKTGRVNRPKKSTYLDAGVMFTEPETGYVRWTGLPVWPTEDQIRHYLVLTEGHISESQRKQVATLIGRNKAWAGITFTLSKGPLTDEEKTEQAELSRQIARKAAVEAHKALKGLE